MPNLIEDRLTSSLAAWLDSNRPDQFPDAMTLPIHIARRDEIRTRPCVVLNTSECRLVPGMPHTARMKLDAHLFSQVDDTPAAMHEQWAATLVASLGNRTSIKMDLDSESFLLHDLIARESVTTPDETRGRETVLTYEAVVSAV